MVQRRAFLRIIRLLAASATLVALSVIVACEGNPVFVEDETEGPQPGDVSVLFIGNSITNWFDMPDQLEALADTLYGRFDTDFRK